METRANYIVIGVFTLAVAIAAVLFGLFAAKFATDRAWNRYEILFTESVIGLSRGSAVLFNGVDVGRVVSLSLNPADVREVLAEVDIDAQVPIHEDTVATVRLTGLTGTAAIQLRGGTPESPLLRGTGDQSPRIQSVESPLARLLESSEGIVVTANRVVERLDRLFGDANLQRIESTLASTESLAAQLADEQGPLQRSLANAAAAGAELPALIEELRAAASRFDRVMARADSALIEPLPALRERVEATLANVESLSARLDTIVGHNQQAMMQLGSRGIPNLSGGVEDLRRLIRDLNSVVRRLEDNPTGFLLGSDQPEEYRPR
jgi:phospholipid/cholesterol/gamma-HCH transport system substrate-binding protein